MAGKVCRSSLEDLMVAGLPHGWFVPVSPGTRQVTIGGAIAADVHGKNHHLAGSFAGHVTSFDILFPCAGGEPHTVTPDADPELFWATAGGMGLTGLITRATIRLKRVESSLVSVDTVKTGDVDETMAVLAEHDKKYGYTVAWSDDLATGKHLGRSIITSGDFATRGRSGPRGQPGSDPFAVRPAREDLAAPAVPARPDEPALDPACQRVLVPQGPEAPRAASCRPSDSSSTRWTGSGTGTGSTALAASASTSTSCRSAPRRPCGRASRWSARHRAPSFVTVLKRFGQGDPGLLSFPAPGWTLALDFPARTPGLGPLLDDLDKLVVANGGRVYLAKDSRVSAATLEQMYPRLPEFRKLRGPSSTPWQASLGLRPLPPPQHLRTCPDAGGLCASSRRAVGAQGCPGAPTLASIATSCLPCAEDELLRRLPQGSDRGAVVGGACAQVRHRRAREVTGR